MKNFGCKSFYCNTESAKPCGYFRCLPSDLQKPTCFSISRDWFEPNADHIWLHRMRVPQGLLRPQLHKLIASLFPGQMPNSRTISISLPSSNSHKLLGDSISNRISLHTNIKYLRISDLVPRAPRGFHLMVIPCPMDLLHLDGFPRQGKAFHIHPQDSSSLLPRRLDIQANRQCSKVRHLSQQ